MDDMNAFERQVVGQIRRFAGPSRPVDDAAIFTTITATQSPKWKFQSMFSATKFVVAGAIVALFGGFLLSGVLVTRQSTETLPVGAFAETRSDILPGVDLEVEEVGPRLVRVLGDGERQTGRNFEDMAVAPNGDVWVMRQNGTVYRLGEPGNAFRQRGAQFSAQIDGTLWVGDRRLEGEEWVEKDFEGHTNSCRPGYGLDGPAGRRVLYLAPDGTCWTVDDGYGYGFGRFDESGQELDIGGLDGYMLGPEWIDFDPDGTVWTTLLGDGRLVGLASYDGTEWTPVKLDVAEGFKMTRLAVAPNGVVWVIGEGRSFSALAMSWDGETWVTHGPQDLSGFGFFPNFDGIEFLPDGSPWFRGFAELDGNTFRLIEVLAPLGDGPQLVRAMANAPDGSTWVVAHPPKQRGRSRLYVITPEAVAAAE